jgi:hypothetical protein
LNGFNIIIAVAGIVAGIAFQFHWMDSEGYSYQHTGLGTGLSIPLNGFHPWWRPSGWSGWCLSFQFHWMDSLGGAMRWARPRRVSLSIPLNGFYSSASLAGITCLTIHLSIPLNGFCTITLYVHCGNFSHLHCMDSIPLSPQVGTPYIWCRIWYLSFSLSRLIRFPMFWIGVSIVYC